MKNAFALLSTPPPEFSEDTVARILHDDYGIEGSLKVLVSERDQNFLVKPKSGESFVFKIANSTEDAGVTDFQTAALLHIAENDTAFPAPRIRPAVNGNTSTRIVGRDGREHIARVLTWLEGIPLRFAEPRQDIGEELGEILARLGMALQDFRHPASGHVLLWDLLHAGNLTELLENIEDEKLRDKCRQRLHIFEQSVEPALNQLRSQVIYNDLNSSNVLVDPKNTASITGIIDFGDMVRSPLVIDVAVAAAYLCESGGKPLSGIVNFLSGFSRVRPLQQNEVDLIYDLIITRNVMTIVITHWRASHHPENRAYILRNEPRARSTIDTLINLGQSNVTDIFLRACRI
jgi:Ser/Thr protein kinase RdoA (MazF antagonist)